MIRINLLPGEERKHRGPSVQIKTGDLMLPALVVGAAIVVMAGAGIAQRTRIVQLDRRIAEVDAEARKLAPQIERVNRLAQEKAELDLRLGVIGKLQDGRTEGVRMMDELAKCVPDHMWLTSVLQDNGNTLNIEGQTFSNLVVSDFMARLERSPMFANVTLETAERGLIEDRAVVKYHLHCQITPNEPAN